MADNYVCNPGSGGSTFRAVDDGTGLLYAVGLCAWGSSLTIADSGSGKGLPVQPCTGASWAVTGTFYQATQPISAASLPLPTGAATAAKQPALGTAGTPSSDVITVQGKASMTALVVDGSGVTQPVSGTFWQATQPVSNAGTFAVQAACTNAGTFAVQAAQSGTWTVGISAAQTIAVTNAGTFAVQAVCTNAGTFATQAVCTNAGTFAVQVSSSLPAGTNVIGHVIVDSGTITTVSTVTAVTTVSTVTSVTAIANALPAGTNTIGNVGNVPLTSGGCSGYSVISSGAANQDAAAIKASAGQIYGYSLFNTTSSARYVKLYNLASGATSSSTPIIRIYLPPTGGANVTLPQGFACSTGISIRLTTGYADNDTGSCSAGDILANVYYA